MSLNESETRVKLVDSKLHQSGWTEEKIERDRYITKGRILNETGDRAKPKKPNYILYYPDKSGIPIAVDRIEQLLSKVEEAKKFQQEAEGDLEKLVPIILDEAFRGKL